MPAAMSASSRRAVTMRTRTRRCGIAIMLALLSLGSGLFLVVRGDSVTHQSAGFAKQEANSRSLRVGTKPHLATDGYGIRTHTEKWTAVPAVSCTFLRRSTIRTVRLCGQRERRAFQVRLARLLL